MALPVHKALLDLSKLEHLDGTNGPVNCSYSLNN